MSGTFFFVCVFREFPQHAQETDANSTHGDTQKNALEGSDKKTTNVEEIDTVVPKRRARALHADTKHNPHLSTPTAPSTSSGSSSSASSSSSLSSAQPGISSSSSSSPLPSSQPGSSSSLSSSSLSSSQPGPSSASSSSSLSSTQCDICLKIFKNFKSLQQHKKRQHSGKRYKCNRCPYAAKRSDSVKEHQKRWHVDESELSVVADSGVDSDAPMTLEVRASHSNANDSDSQPSPERHTRDRDLGDGISRSSAHKLSIKQEHEPQSIEVGNSENSSGEHQVAKAYVSGEVDKRATLRDWAGSHRTASKQIEDVQKKAQDFMSEDVSISDIKSERSPELSSSVKMPQSTHESSTSGDISENLPESDTTTEFSQNTHESSTSDKPASSNPPSLAPYSSRSSANVQSPPCAPPQTAESRAPLSASSVSSIAQDSAPSGTTRTASSTGSISSMELHSSPSGRADVREEHEASLNNGPPKGQQDNAKGQRPQQKHIPDCVLAGEDQAPPLSSPLTSTYVLQNPSDSLSGNVQLFVSPNSTPTGSEALTLVSKPTTTQQSHEYPPTPSSRPVSSDSHSVHERDSRSPDDADIGGETLPTPTPTPRDTRRRISSSVAASDSSTTSAGSVTKPKAADRKGDAPHSAPSAVSLPPGNVTRAIPQPISVSNSMPKSRLRDHLTPEDRAIFARFSAPPRKVMHFD